ncbi:MAG TPA: multicopper oxidase domain-containing protein [Acidobacteriaceae bacterium]|nr:multicopper oxidase domain-containing protein [Acidobacteriaceae bacterium]
MRLGGATLLGAGAAGIARGQMGPMQSQRPSAAGADGTGPGAGKADFTLEIAPVALELVPNRIISTIGYNGTCPGPLLRMREGVPVTVDVINNTDASELVHWHGMLIPPEVDGAEEEGTPPVPPMGRRRYQFTPKPAGTRWYHTHAMAGGDLHRGTYTGQFGFVMVEPASHPGQYDQEVFLALRDWEPFFTEMMDNDEGIQGTAEPERPAVLDTRPNGLEVTSMMYSINDKALGAGEPIRVKSGERVLMHLLNASAIENRLVALPGHQFQVIALDGNPVPSPRPVEVLLLGPGERVDAIVEMNQPGVWILGAPEDDIRNAGLGVVVEYAGEHREPQWIAPRRLVWDYTLFGREGAAPPAPDQTIDMVFEKVPSGSGRFNLWHVNGKPYPHDREFVLKQGARYRLIFHNRTDDAHPLHLHRHVLELVEINGKPTAGIIKDTVVVPFFGRASVDFVADQPGLTFFHCHIQQHMDFGFKALFRYA